MPEQESLVRQPGEAGLWRQVLDNDGHINHGAWLRIRSENGFVGTCRRCGDYLTPSRPDEISAGRTDYHAECRREACGYELDAPGGRVLRRSTLLSERPKTGG